MAVAQRGRAAKLRPLRHYLSQQLLLTLILALTFSQSGVWRRRRGEFWIDEVARIGYATPPDSC